ncbi:hypothetical protein [Actinoplanes aureus]|uniref:Uncharacterized protein n=1 Tax=Actinoplanes aureus TaxID=2792083 RepID=A0A931CLW3_9ACTN|nr:hypothetical protein [Actinoplanes aureus]MBG0567325.1 hypothetical protein [Actinoplanes aureus]
MSTENRAARMSRLVADKDARVQDHRQRPLPAWLAGRGTRRAIAVLPVLPLAGGLVAGTMADSLARTTVMVVVVTLCVGLLLLLRQASRMLDAVPDRMLDEREVGERDNAHRRAHALTVGLLTVLVLVAIADGVMRKTGGSSLIDGDGWINVTLTAMLVGAMMPAAVLTWRGSEPLDDLDG